MIFGKKKAVSQYGISLNSLSNSEEIQIQGTSLTIQTEIIRSAFMASQFGSRESRLQITIVNSGEKKTNNLSIEATAPVGSELIDPGALFGSSRRFVRMPPLAPGKKIRYKLGIRISEHFEVGDLNIRISTVLVGKIHESVNVCTTLHSSKRS